MRIVYSVAREEYMAQDVTTPVLRNLDLGHGYHLIEFGSAGAAGQARPAQFFMIGVPGAEILLRRPFSVCGIRDTFTDRQNNTLQVLYKVVGRGTALLAALKRGADITVLGPLGRGFEPPPSPSVRPVIVAGGIGCAPFPALAGSLHNDYERPIMFYGGRSKTDLPLLDWFRAHTELVAVTDDGSLGSKALVTAPLTDWLDADAPPQVKVYACGPEPMLHAVARLALERGLDCELSLEAHMACGFGVCLGCVVPCRGKKGGVEYHRVCVEGPVMRPEALAW